MKSLCKLTMSHCLHDSNLTAHLQSELIRLYVRLGHNLHGVLLPGALIDGLSYFTESALAEKVEHEILTNACNARLERAWDGGALVLL